MCNKLGNKVAVVTGSGRGIGQLVAAAFAKEGAKVVVNGLTRDKVDEVVAAIRGEGGTAVANYDSVASLARAERIIAAAVDNFGRIDILVNNAIVQRDAMMHKMSEEHWNEVIAVGLTGPWACTKAALPHMREQGGGRIINVTSAAGWAGNVGQANYSAAKGGLIALTKANAKEFGRYNITVNAVAPSFFTRMHERVPKDIFEATLKQRALGRMPEPYEVPPVFVLLASDEGGYITGQIIGVTGGIFI